MNKTLVRWTVSLAVLTLIFLAVAIVPTFILEDGDKLMCQMDNWAWILATLSVAVEVILLTILFAKRKHPFWRVTACLVCFVLEMACLVSFYGAVMRHNHKVWSDKDFVVYMGRSDGFDPHLLVLYKKDGLVDRQMYSLCSTYGLIKKFDCTIDKDTDLIKVEMDDTDLDGYNVYHNTLFYRLSNGHPYEQDKVDSL